RAEELPDDLEAIGLDATQRAVKSFGLQPCKLCHQRLTLGGGEKKALAAIVVARLLHDISLVEQLLEDASERLLGDPQHVEEIGDLQAGVAVDKMQHAVMGAAKTECFQFVVGIADEVAIGKKQKLDEVPAQASDGRRRAPLARLGAGSRKRARNYVSHVDIYSVQCYKTPAHD